MMKHAAARISTSGPTLFHLLCVQRVRWPVSLSLFLLFLHSSTMQLCLGQTPITPAESGSFPDVMLRERPRSQWLIKIAASLEGNRLAEAIEDLQKCFDAPEDVVLPRADKHGISLRNGAADLLRNAGEDVWTSYETAYGAEASRLLERAANSGEVADYHQIIRRFAHTAAGGQALDRLANWYFDRGDYDLCVSCWNHLFSNPVHAKRTTNLQYFKLVIAASRCGAADEFRLLEKSLQSQKVVLGGQARSFEEWQARLTPAGGASAPIQTDWKVFGGDSERSQITFGSAPFLRPKFKLSLFDSQSPATKSGNERDGLDEARSLLQQELSDRRGAGVAFGFAGGPLVTRDWIILRDALGIRVLDRNDQRTLWTYRTTSALTVENSGLTDADSGALRQSSFLQNSVLCQLSCDARQVYLIDQNTVPERQASLQFDVPDVTPRLDGKPTPPPWNRLLALRLVNTDPHAGADDKQDRRLAWKVGGHPFDEATAPLKGHFFLGPPLPVGDVLYAVSEYQKVFYLTALQPESGHILWRQVLAYVPVPSRETPLLGDRLRLAPACFIAGARGILVCPLGAGVLVGMDQLTGDFAWIYDYRWRIKPQRFQVMTAHNSIEQSIESDFPNPPLIHAGRVYFLAPGDTSNNLHDHVHCLDLKTGEKIWQAECRDAKYLAVLNDDRLLAVAGNYIQALASKNGAILWTRRIPVIAGVGAVMHDSYLLPVNDGRIMALSANDGSELGYSMPSNGMQLGNLIVHGQEVISENGLELQVFPQATERLAELKQRRAAELGQFADLLEIGEVYFRLGQLEEAKSQLKRALSVAGSDTERSAVRQVSRELAWRELIRSPEQRAAALADFHAACEEPEHFAQYLLAKGQDEIQNANWTAARQTSRELLELNVEQSLRSLDDAECLLTSEAWSAALSERITREAPIQIGLLDNEPSVQQVIDRGNLTQLRSFLIRHPSLPEAYRVRQALARKLQDDGQAQAAEFTVWQDHLGSGPVALAADQFLVQLWGDAGLNEEAGRLLHRIGTQLADVKGDNGQTGREIYAAFPRQSLVWSAAQRFVPVDWKVESVKITELHEIDRQLRVTFSNWPRSLYFPQSSNQFFLRGQTTPFFLRQVNMETGSIVADFSLPTGSRIFYPQQFPDVRQRLGHFVPAAGLTNCFGVSLLDRGVVWQRTTASAIPSNSVVWIGPTSPHSCVFRSRNRLLSLDPSDGKLLWERTDLEEVPRPQIHLTAIPGDDEAILLVEPDEFKSYRVFKRSDGSLIREGRLQNCTTISDCFGRNLLYEVAETPQQNRGIRLWDPVTDQTLFEYHNPRTMGPIILSQMSNPIHQPEIEGEFALAESSGRVRIIEGRTGKIKLDVELGEGSIRAVPALRLFSDADRYYVNVQNNPIGVGMQTLYAETKFQMHQVMGDLYAFDRHTSERLWMRKNLPTQSIVHLSDYRLPFLVSLNRTGRTNRMNNSIGLRLEVIDAQTGQTLATQSNVLHDQLFLMDYDRDAGRLRFRGSVTQLQVNFGREINNGAREADELVTH
jgi:outer membrane protein assembly factor BamB